MSENKEKYVKKILCPTCYTIREQPIREELYESLELGDALINQCEECREKGLEINLDELDKLKEVITGGIENARLIDEQSIKDGVQWIKENLPEMFQKMVDLFDE